jgi:hypothetical protein
MPSENPSSARVLAQAIAVVRACEVRDEERAAPSSSRARSRLQPAIPPDPAASHPLLDALCVAVLLCGLALLLLLSGAATVWLWLWLWGQGM